ncbi:damage-inducible protein DinB [Gordoniibacillus kamchatkensis]|uniref:Damage-inducible protein DinB n=1 Tax=Gordoniibacillus kamchatkensis TaxID=1590651 RepID=A0ABR5AFQ7_9BACL|nr:DinB family protein [Paenibacillus sp. VKM B-2647]KIL39886.1 damage-inducible protein DinB [Paenibacillus sp. VKM B-2647]
MEAIARMFDHLHWANERILAAFGGSNGNEQAIRLFVHILQAEEVWLTRLLGKDSSHIPLWPEASADDCRTLVSRNRASLTEYLAQVSANGSWEEVISYTNQTGKSFTTSIRDILTHLALHGQYHRGQINAMLRAAGSEPVNVDYITYVRET